MSMATLLLAGCSAAEPGAAPGASAAREAPAARPDSTPRADDLAAVQPFDVRADTADAEVAADLERVLAEGTSACDEFFGEGFTDPFTVYVCRDRATFAESFPAEWEMGETECWMVGVGVADALYLLSPRVWATEACEHDPTDARAVQGLVTHELVHVFHGQHNPSRDFTGAEEVGWFAEGLAVYVSGQLDDGHLADPREAVALGLTPTRLQDAWSGRYRYGVCGSLVRHIDRTCGRQALVRMLGAVRQQQLLDMIGLSEEELLAQWKQSVLAEQR